MQPGRTCPLVCRETSGEKATENRTILLILSFDMCIITAERLGGDFVSITATELKMNLGKYLLMAEKEDIYITRNGKIVAKLSNPYQNRVDVAKSLFGIIPDEMTLEEAREERLGKI